jgi:CysZ protein
MEAFFIAAARAVKSLFTPGMFGLFILTVALTIAALAGFVIFTSGFFIWLGNSLQGSSMAPLLPWLGSIGSVILAWLLFPGIMPIIASFFDDRIARTIEQHEYTAQTAREPAFLPELLHDIRFALTAIFLNIVVLPLYLLPVINLILFYLLNGYLLGREFFVMSAKRHMAIAEAEMMRKRHGRVVMASGMALTLMATIPLLNLLAPFWGIALMVHLYHQLAKTPANETLIN